MGVSVPLFERRRVATVAVSPSTRSAEYWIFSPPYSSILEMYERSRRSLNRETNSARCLSVRGCQWRPRERRAISLKSKISSAIFRTAARRSVVRSALFRLGSSTTLTTRSIALLSWSVGGPAATPRGATIARTAASIRAHSRRRVIEPSTVIEPSRAGSRTARPSDLAEHILRQDLFEVDGRLHLFDAAVRGD